MAVGLLQRGKAPELDDSAAELNTCGPTYIQVLLNRDFNYSGCMEKERDRYD